jgi:hypothetical protein
MGSNDQFVSQRRRKARKNDEDSVGSSASDSRPKRVLLRRSHREPPCGEIDRLLKHARDLLVRVLLLVRRRIRRRLDSRVEGRGVGNVDEERGSRGFIATEEGRAGGETLVDCRLSERVYVFNQ